MRRVSGIVLEFVRGFMGSNEGEERRFKSFVAIIAANLNFVIKVAGS